MQEPRIWRQHKWTDSELRAMGFQRYETQRQLRMARVVDEATEVDSTKEKLVADAGYMMCYSPGSEIKSDLEEYDQWPVRFDLFHQNYKAWLLSGWQPNPAEQHLMDNGCKPYYKTSSVWASRLKKSVALQSLESKEPVQIPPGRWLCIGAEGEPYHTADKKFCQNYIVPEYHFLERLYWITMRTMGRAE